VAQPEDSMRNFLGIFFITTSTSTFLFLENFSGI